MKLSVPNPCNQSLNDMQPINGGYHCNSCAHSVIDFRGMDTDEIQSYFKQKNGSRICGIIDKPKDEIIIIRAMPNHFYKGISKVFFAGLFFVFSNLFSGCDSPKSQPEQPDNIDPVEMVGIIEPVKTDSTIDKIFPAQEKPETKSKTPQTNISPNITIEDIVVNIETPSIDKQTDTKENPTIFGMVSEIPPQFPGGNENLYKFLRDNIVYPNDGLQKNITGKVYVKFAITENGDVEDAKIMRGIESAPEFGGEVLRVINKMPKWKPGKMNGIPIKFYYNLPIEFSPK